MMTGGIELLVVLGLALLFLGPPRLPKAGRAIGRATKEWRRGRSETNPDEE